MSGAAWLHQHQGPLTRELLLEPAGFGLGLVPARCRPDTTTTTTCGYCSTGCNLTVHQKDGRAVGLTSTTDHPVNLGMACPKGWEALSVLDAPDRATMPLRRNAAGKLESCDWDCALRLFVSHFKQIQATHGSDAVAFLSTGQIATEEMALLGALAKFGMGILHGDGNTRQCMATSVVAYKQSFGFDAPPYAYQDFEESDVIVLVGSNLCIAHPIMWERVMRNPHQPQIVVIDPRMTETAMNATLHLPLHPKSDQVLLYAIALLLIENDWVDHDFIAAHTAHFQEFADFLEPYTLDRAASDTGLERDQILKLAGMIHQGKRVSFWWTMGVNQSHQGVRTAQAIINLALMTGNIGRAGTGANSITGQCNAMGSRLFSNTTNLLGGHEFTNRAHRQKIAGILGIDPARIPARNSLSYDEIIEGILREQIKGLWVICTNPAHSWVNQKQCRDILERLDFLVVQEMYHSSETAQMADLVLPAAGWGEKQGTFINSERRIGLINKVAKAPGLALADFHIFKLVADYWGCSRMFQAWQNPEAVFQILKRCTRGQPCDITGIDDYSMIERRRGIQWPCPAADSDPAPQRRLFADGRFFHPDHKAHFLFAEPRPLPEATTAKYPFVLLTGRGSASQWHTQTRTRRSAILRKLYPDFSFVEINPDDARRYGINPGEWVVVESQRGETRARALLTHAVRHSQLFLPMHDEGTNRLTDSVFDPHSKQPAYKACAVRIRGEHAVL